MGESGGDEDELSLPDNSISGRNDSWRLDVRSLSTFDDISIEFSIAKKIQCFSIPVIGIALQTVTGIEAKTS